MKMDIRIKIRVMMDERGMTTYALAQKSGLSVACITNWQERGYEPSLKALTKISEAFGISLAELFCENDSQMVPIGEDKRCLLNLWERLDEEERNIILSVIHKLLYNKMH